MIPPHLYIFTNNTLQLAQPGDRILHAGGLQRCIEEVEELAVLEHDAMLRCNLDGVFIRTLTGEERIADPVLHLSDRLLQSGITENWFTEGWAFGNGVTCHKTKAKYETKLVAHEVGCTLEQVIQQQGFLDFSMLKLYQVHDRTEGWEVYERRWRAGTCPLFTHFVHLTWLSAKHEIRGYGYQRILELIEEGAAPKYPEAYASPGEPGKFFSRVREVGKEPSKEVRELLKGLPFGRN